MATLEERTRTGGDDARIHDLCPFASRVTGLWLVDFGAQYFMSGSSFLVSLKCVPK
jgi:hypothetical protein